jgi:hypothetical protein
MNSGQSANLVTNRTTATAATTTELSSTVLAKSSKYRLTACTHTIMWETYHKPFDRATSLKQTPLYYFWDLSSVPYRK